MLPDEYKIDDSDDLVITRRYSLKTYRDKPLIISNSNENRQCRYRLNLAETREDHVAENTDSNRHTPSKSSSQMSSTKRRCSSCDWYTTDAHKPWQLIEQTLDQLDPDGDLKI